MIGQLTILISLIYTLFLSKNIANKKIQKRCVCLCSSAYNVEIYLVGILFELLNFSSFEFDSKIKFKIKQ